MDKNKVERIDFRIFTFLFWAFIILLGILSNNEAKSQGDCPAQFVCTGGNFTAVVDITDELNSSNNGCLAVNEGTTSYWYQICVSNGGTIQFTIAPQGNNNDYDWAVWSGNTCPPSTTPIRCSFAISNFGPGADNTGVNSVNNSPQTDLTEGAGGNQWVQDINALTNECFTICINNYGTGSNNFNLTFGGTATLSCTPLSVELWYFKGEITENNYNLLKWSTISELNNDYFILEKSTDMIIWENIAKVDGSGNSNEIIYYEYLDQNIIGNSISFYRLKQVDYNGNYEYSNILSFNNQQIINRIIKRYNQLGQEVNDDYIGLIFELYSDGTIHKTIKY